MNAYELITSRMIQLIEAGKNPWRMPWAFAKDADGRGAYNFVSKKSYSLLNCMLLGKAGKWGTFKQWTAAGYRIRKGEHGSPVVFWKPIEDEEDGKIVRRGMVLKHYFVFHESQIEGYSAPETSAETEAVETDGRRIESADAIIRDYTAREGIEYCEDELSNKAYFSPSAMRVVVPNSERFGKIAEFYSTIWHELTHSTGVKLGREMSQMRQKYSFEELVAEMGAAFLSGLLGTGFEEIEENSAAYLRGWLKPLKENVKFVVLAASKAEKAVKLITGENA